MNLNPKAEQRAAKRERIEKAMETTYSSYHSPKMVADKIIAAREAEQPVTDMQAKPHAPIPLYYHRTDGGAEYLSDKFLLCDNGHREGIFEGATYIVRLDGDPQLTVKNAVNTELLEALEAALTLKAEDSTHYNHTAVPHNMKVKAQIRRAVNEYYSDKETISKLLCALNCFMEIPHDPNAPYSADGERRQYLTNRAFEEAHKALAAAKGETKQ